MKSASPEEDQVMIFFSKWSKIREFPKTVVITAKY